MRVATESEYRLRELHHKEQDRLMSEKLEQEKKNSDFTQVYDAGWRQIENLIMSNPGAARLYTFLARHIDPSCGAVVASQELLAKELSCSTKTIRNYGKYLEETGALIRIRIMGSVYAYAMNPKEVWKSWDSRKEYAAFNTKTLASNKLNGDIKRRLMIMMEKSENKEESTKQSKNL